MPAAGSRARQLAARRLESPACMATDDEDFAAMFAESEKDKPRAKRPKIGDLVKGKIITVGKEAVFVDLGGKAEGQLERDQVTFARSLAACLFSFEDFTIERFVGHERHVTLDRR